MPEQPRTPARRAAADAQQRVHECIDQGKHFLLEAGAGSGKTYSLVEALKYVISKYGRQLTKLAQRVACITYTNVARDEIETRTDKHPVVLAATIHAFLWETIRDFQPFMRSELIASEKWKERIATQGEIGSKPIEYNLGYPKIEPDKILLGHNDVLAFATKLLGNQKFRMRLGSTFPIIFIDEYQDTEEDLAESLVRNIIASSAKPQIGLFGDHWQAIYKGVCGRLSSPNLTNITKGANFRSAPTIINFLNQVRSELPQLPDNLEVEGSVRVFHTNSWAGQRRTETHWKGDLPPEISTRYQQLLLNRLANEGWDFSSSDSKVLMLTHRVLATQQGYSSLVDVFSGSNDLFAKKEDKFIKFFADVVEPSCIAFTAKKYGELTATLGGQRPIIKSPSDKRRWSEVMSQLIALRETATIGEVVSFLAHQPLLELRPPEIPQINHVHLGTGEVPELSNADRRWNSMSIVPYREMIRMVEFIQDKTPFSTKHGVKGAEFERVAVIVGRGWNDYNFGQYLELARAPSDIPPSKQASFERNRNLFYVACSRAKRHLVILFTQQLSATALATLSDWLPENSIFAIPNDV